MADTIFSIQTLKFQIYAHPLRVSGLAFDDLNSLAHHESLTHSWSVYTCCNCPSATVVNLSCSSCVDFLVSTFDHWRFNWQFLAFRISYIHRVWMLRALFVIYDAYRALTCYSHRVYVQFRTGQTERRTDGHLGWMQRIMRPPTRKTTIRSKSGIAQYLTHAATVIHLAVDDVNNNQYRCRSTRSALCTMCSRFTAAFSTPTKIYVS